MSTKMPLRQFLLFRELISRNPQPTITVNRLLGQYPQWDPEESRTWEAWKEADLPNSGPATETVDTDVL